MPLRNRSIDDTAAMIAAALSTHPARPWGDGVGLAWVTVRRSIVIAALGSTRHVRARHGVKTAGVRPVALGARRFRAVHGRRLVVAGQPASTATRGCASHTARPARRRGRSAERTTDGAQTASRIVVDRNRRVRERRLGGSDDAGTRAIARLDGRSPVTAVRSTVPPAGERCVGMRGPRRPAPKRAVGSPSSLGTSTIARRVVLPA
jgi:hypothetical protein